MEMIKDSRLTALTRRLLNEFLPRAEEIERRLEKAKSEGLDFFSTRAEASLQLWLARDQGLFEPPFSVKKWLILDGDGCGSGRVCEATMTIAFKSKSELFVAEGKGPVNALDLCFKKGLKSQKISSRINLVGYEAEDLNQEAGSAARMRITTVFSNGKKTWKTIGCHDDILVASFRAIQDAYLYPFFLEVLFKRE